MDLFKYPLLVFYFFSSAIFLSLNAQTYEEMKAEFINCLRETEDHSKCASQVNAVLDFLKEQKNWKEYCLSSISKEYYVLGKAVEDIEKHLLKLTKEKIKEDSLKSLVLAHAYSRLLSIAYSLQNFEAAKDFGLKSLEQLDQISTPDYEMMENIAHSLSNLYLWSLGNTKKALRYAQKSLEYAEKAYGREHERTVHATGNLAIVYNVMGAVNDASDYYKRAINIAESIEESPKLIIAKSRLYQNVAMLENRNMLEYLEEALKLVRRIEALGEIADLQSRIGYIHVGNQDFEKAKVCFEEALHLLDQHSDQTVILSTKSTIYQAYGEHTLKEGNIPLAKEYYQKALSVFEKAYPNHRIHFISIIYQNMGEEWEDIDLLESLEYYKKAIVSNSPTLSMQELEENPSNCLNHAFFNQNQIIANLNSYAQALKIKYEEDKEIPNLINGLKAVNTILELGYENIKRLTTPQDQLFLLESLYENFALGAELSYILYQETADLKYMDMAFKFCESNKSFILQQSLNHEQALVNSQVPEEIISEEYQLKVKLSQLEQERLYLQKNDTARMEGLTEEIFKQKEALKALYQRLKADYGKYYRLAYQSTQIRLKEVPQYLREEEALLEYFMTKDYLFLFYISKEGQKEFFRIDWEDSFNQKVTQFHQYLSDFGILEKDPAQLLGDYQNLAVDIYAKLIPKELNLSTSSKLRIVADGQLNHIPFEALISQTSEAKSFSDLDYLLRKCAISYAYSASLLEDLKENSNAIKRKRILGIAAAYHQEKVDYQGAQAERLKRLRASMQALPATRQEVSFLEANFKGDYWMDMEANEKKFKQKAKDYAVIHLAMHGILNQENPSNSALVFSEDGKAEEDDFLHVYELMQMELNADLVVLSACETGFGKFEQGEGVMSLARAFMYTGAKSLLMSLWQVNDQSTAELMQNFYKKLAKGKTKDVALQEAKLDYLSRSNGIAAHPAFWAAFIQLGNTNAIQLKTKSSFLWIWALALGGLVLILFLLLKNRFKKRF